MKNILLLSIAILFLISCKKDQELDFVYEPILVKNIVVEMDTFSGNNFSLNDFAINARSEAEQALLNSEYQNFNSFEVQDIEMKSISIVNIVSSYSVLDEIDTVAFFVNGIQVFKRENSFGGGLSPVFYSGGDFNFINVYDQTSSTGLEDTYKVSLLPKSSATSAKNRYTLTFSYQPKIEGVYTKVN